MKREQITVTLTLPPGVQATVGIAQDIFDALDAVAHRMGADVSVEHAAKPRRATDDVEESFR